MRRREFVIGLAATSICRAKAQERVHRVAALVTTQAIKESFERVLVQHGWTLGRDVLIEYRITGGETERSRQAARELLAEKPEVIFANTNTSMAALAAEGSTIPTVFAMVSDPIGMHYVESFARPGGNVTGFTPFEPSLGGKWVSMLKEIAPGTEHLGIIYNPEPGNNSSAFRQSIDEVAKTTGMLSIDTPVGDSDSIERVIFTLKDKPNSGLIFLPDALTASRKDRIVAIVEECRLPAIYPLRLFCAAGGLVSYGPNLEKVNAGAAAYVDRILRGAKPAELPVQTPSEFELIVNLKTAKRLDLQLPNVLLARADEVIE